MFFSVTLTYFKTLFFANENDVMLPGLQSIVGVCFSLVI